MQQLQEKLRSLTAELDSSFFCYDLDALNQHMQDLVRSSQDRIRLWYAVKANPLSSLLQLAKQNHYGFDISSAGELEQVLAQGVKGADILCTGPAKSKKLLELYLARGIQIFVVESLQQTAWLQEAAAAAQRKVKVLLRLQLTWQNTEANLIGGEEITAFGLEPASWEKLNIRKLANLEFLGVHVFQWSNLLSNEKLLDIWQESFIQGKLVAEKLGFDLQVVDLGGGLGIPYAQQASQLSWESLMVGLQKLQAAFAVPFAWLELGRFLVGPYGYFITQIVDRKIVRGQNILVLQSGINHMARCALTGQSFPCSVVQARHARAVNFQVHGPLCTAMDYLGNYDLPKDVQIGDWLLFAQVGAYGFSESMPFFLGHAMPAEMIYQNHDFQTVRAAKPAKDYFV